MCAICQTFTGNPDIGEKLFYAAYIDPGTGYVFSSIIPAIFGAVVTLLSTLLLLFRKRIWPFFKKNIWLFLFVFILIIVSTILFVVKVSPMQKSNGKKVVIIGLDGLDPKLVEQGFKRKLLPNLKKIAETGSYSLLKTTMPPQSPVAWASFITGVDSGKHKIYDFIERNPPDYSLDLVFSNPNKSPIQSTPFWEVAEKQGIPVEVLFLPDTFPTSSFKGKMISGMGTPDILGTEGIFTLFSTKKHELDPKWRGRLVSIPNKDVIKTSVPGPKYMFLKDKKTSSLDIEIFRNKEKKSITLAIQGKKYEVLEKEFSSWIPLQFSIDFFTKIHAITRFYLKSAESNLELYMSPMNIDPKSPVFKIGNPKGFSKELTDAYGYYSTLGLPHDTWALEEDIFDEKTFLRQAEDIFDERKKIILGELLKFKGGIFFGYFGVTDTISHMFWRYLDQDGSLYQNTIMSYYQKVDRVVGEVMKKIGPDDTLIVMSDHGFDRFDYEMNVNTWLKENGYLVLKEGKDEGRELLEDIDWGKTKAYAIGYNGTFINLVGREGQGNVGQSEAEEVEKELFEKLMDVVNPLTGKKVFKKIYTRRDLGIPANDVRAPDLQLGYFAGLRSSWDTAVGAVPKEVFRKREGKWSGDHLFDATEIPGVIFVNRKIKKGINPAIIDVIPTAFNVFDMAFEDSVEGKNILE